MRTVKQGLLAGTMAAVLLAVVGGAAVPAMGQTAKDPSAAEMQKKMDDMQAQLADMAVRLNKVQQQQISKEEMIKLMDQWQADAAKRGSGMPQWAEGLKFFGDVRLRAEGQWFDKRTDTKLTPSNYDRLRYRLRFGFSKEINEDWSVGFRLTTGNGSDPWETNQTMTGDFVRNSIYVDQAWIQYKPKALNGELTVLGGRFVPTLIGTDMTLDPDVTFSGIAESIKHPMLDNKMNLFANLTQTFLEQNRTNGTNTEYNGDATAMMAYQVGASYDIAPDITWTAAGTFWNYFNIDRDSAMATDEAAGQSNNIPLGNSLVTRNGTTYLGAGRFNMLDGYTDVTFRLGQNKTPLRVFADAVWNVSDQASGVYDGQHTAFIGGFALGKNNWKKGDWELGYNYRYVAADSMIAVFSDNAFWGTDKKGHTINARYCVADNVTFNFKYVHFDWIVDTADPARDMIRFEIEARF